MSSVYWASARTSCRFSAPSTNNSGGCQGTWRKSCQTRSREVGELFPSASRSPPECLIHCGQTQARLRSTWTGHALTQGLGQVVIRELHLAAKQRFSRLPVLRNDAAPNRPLGKQRRVEPENAHQGRKSQLPSFEDDIAIVQPRQQPALRLVRLELHHTKSSPSSSPLITILYRLQILHIGSSMWAARSSGVIWYIHHGRNR